MSSLQFSKLALLSPEPKRSTVRRTQTKRTPQDMQNCAQNSTHPVRVPYEFTPCAVDIARQYGPITALVYGAIYRSQRANGEHCDMTIAQIAASLRIAPRTARYHIVKLKSLGHVVECCRHGQSAPTGSSKLYKTTAPIGEFTACADTILARYGAHVGSVWSAIRNFQNMSLHECTASMVTIGDKLGINERTVRRAIRVLKEDGQIVERPRQTNAYWRTKCYLTTGNFMSTDESASESTSAPAEVQKTEQESPGTPARESGDPGRKVRGPRQESPMKRPIQKTEKDLSKTHSQHGKNGESSVNDRPNWLEIYARARDSRVASLPRENRTGFAEDTHIHFEEIDRSVAEVELDRHGVEVQCAHPPSAGGPPSAATFDDRKRLQPQASLDPLEHALSRQQAASVSSERLRNWPLNRSVVDELANGETRGKVDASTSKCINQVKAIVRQSASEVGLSAAPRLQEIAQILQYDVADTEIAAAIRIACMQIVQSSGITFLTGDRAVSAVAVHVSKLRKQQAMSTPEDSRNTWSLEDLETGEWLSIADRGTTIAVYRMLQGMVRKSDTGKVLQRLHGPDLTHAQE